MNISSRGRRVATFVRRRLVILLPLALILSILPLSKVFQIVPTTHAAALTPGNVVVYRVGVGGATALAATATPVFLDEYTPAGALVQSIALPTTAAGSGNRALTANGTSSTEGLITRSADGQYLIVTGYNSTTGGTTSGATSATTNRVIGRVNASGTVDTTTSLSDAFSGGNIRSAVSSDGTTFWMAGSVDGLRTATLGATTSSLVSITQTNLRQVNIFNGQLYVSSGSGTNTTRGVNKVGSGLPTGSGNTTTRLAGFTDTTAPSTYSYVILDDPNNAVSGLDTIYIGDDTTSGTEGGMQKWTSTDGVNWAKQYRALSGTAAFRGVTGQYVGSTLSLFATTTDNKLISVTDTGSGFTFTTIATAATNTAFRGVALAPGTVGGGGGATNPSGTGAATPSTVSPGDSTLLTVNVTPGANPASTGLAVTANLTNIGGSSTQQFFDNGTNGDVTASDNIFSFSTTVGGGTTNGAKSLPVTITDAQARTGNTNISLTVQAPPTVTAIYVIQGSGETSPLVGQSVTTTGVVTGRKTNGYFIQDPLGDGNTNTSDAVFVFTSSTPSGIGVGDSVRVTGTVAEFISATTDEPTSASEPKTATELTSPTTVVLSSGNPLPTPLTESIFNPSAASRGAQLEKYEDMRVGVASLTVSEATNNNFGEFWGVTTGTPRPYREPGIETGDPIPAADQGPYAGTQPPNIPIFDGNFERIMVDSDEALTSGGARRTAVFVTTGAVMTGVVGPLDYAFDNYRIVLDATATLNVTPGITAAIPVPTRTAQEFTVGHANLENFGVSNAGFAGRLNKASLAIRNVMRTPDVLGMIEIYDLTTLQQLATKVNTDAGNPSAVNYVAYLQEGIDGAGDDQDVGFLVNTARVSVVGTPTQYHKGTTFTYCGTTSTLHDRPAYVLNVTVPQTSGPAIPATVIINHTKSLIASDSQLPFGSCGTGTEGARNREKRRLQAEDIADLIATHSAENLVVLGDLNAFDFNDGLGDVVGTLKGTPVSADQVVEPSTDRWTYTLTNLGSTLPATERYSFSFEGNAQALDHVLVSPSMLAHNTRFAYGRYNGDFSIDYAADTNRPERLADHDAAVAYFSFPSAVATTLTVDPASGTYGGTANLSATLTDGANPVSGKSISFTLNGNSVGSAITNGSGIATVSNVSLSGINAGNYPGAVGASFAGDSGYLASNGSNSLTVNKATPVITWSNPADITYGTALSGTQLNATANTAGTFVYTPAASTVLPSGNNQNLHVDFTPTDTTNYDGASKDVSINVLSAHLSMTKVAEAATIDLGKIFTYTLTISNAGQVAATSLVVTDPLPASMTFYSATASQGTCSFTSGNNTVTCSLGSLASSSSATITIKVKGRQEGNFNNTATFSSPEFDPSSGSASASAPVQIVKYADLKVTKVDSIDPIYVGEQTTYTMVVKNFGPVNSTTGTTLTDTLPAGMTFVSATTSQGALVTPPIGSTGIVTANLGSLGVNATATVTVTVQASAAGTPTNTASVSSNETDPVAGNNTASQVTTVYASVVLQKVLLSNQSPVGGCTPYPTGQVYLTTPAGAGGVTVNLSSTNAGATVPASVFIAAGQTKSDPFVVTTVVVPKRQDGNIVASITGSNTVTRSLQVYAGTCSQ